MLIDTYTHICVNTHKSIKNDVFDIVLETGLNQTNVSFHLRLLREAELVRTVRRGAFIYYCLPDA